MGIAGDPFYHKGSGLRGRHNGSHLQSQLLDEAEIRRIMVQNQPDGEQKFARLHLNQ
jgi:hypothetical protein